MKKKKKGRKKQLIYLPSGHRNRRRSRSLRLRLATDLLRPPQTTAIAKVPVSTRTTSPLGGVLCVAHGAKLLDRHSTLLALALPAASQQALQFIGQSAVPFLQLTQLDLPAGSAGGVELRKEGYRVGRG